MKIKQKDIIYAKIADFTYDRMRIEWAIKNFGFGEINFRIVGDGVVFIDSETLDKKFVMSILKYIVKNATLE